MARLEVQAGMTLGKESAIRILIPEVPRQSQRMRRIPSLVYKNRLKIASAKAP